MLSNRSEQEAQRLHGVDLLDDPIDVPFGTFCGLSNWICKTIYSITKKRGVATVPAGAQIVIVPCDVAVAQFIMCGDEVVVVCGDPLVCSVA